MKITSNEVILGILIACCLVEMTGFEPVSIRHIYKRLPQ